LRIPDQPGLVEKQAQLQHVREDPVTVRRVWLDPNRRNTNAVTIPHSALKGASVASALI